MWSRRQITTLRVLLHLPSFGQEKTTDLNIPDTSTISKVQRYLRKIHF